MRAAVDAVAAGEVRAEALPRMLDAAVNDTHRTPTEIVASFSASPQDGSLGAILDEVALRARDREGLTPEASLRWAMGEAMRTLLGRADPSEVRSLLAGALGSQDGGDPVEEGRS
jgi:Asp-tRNA(Asn)/Glu-tRNA(Gln) amidotransferase B subunit